MEAIIIKELILKTAEEEIIKEALRSEIEKISANKFAEKASEKVLSLEYKIDFDNPPEKIKDYKLFKEIAEMKNNKEISSSIYNKMRVDSNFKGQAGEYFGLKNCEDKFGGDISCQVRAGNSRIDLLVDKSNKNVKVKELILKDDFFNIEDTYIPKGKSIAVEFKNGSAEYLKTEIKNGHLINQIIDGKSISDIQLVGIRKDVANNLVDNSEMVKYIKQVNDVGGKVVILLPSQETQISVIMGVC